MAEEQAACVAGKLDGPEDEADAQLQVRRGARGGGRAGAQPVRSAVQSQEHQPYRSDRRRHPQTARQAGAEQYAVRGEVIGTDSATSRGTTTMWSSPSFIPAHGIDGSVISVWRRA